MIKNASKLILQYILPHHIISRLAGIVANCRVRWLKNFLIKRFIAHYHVNMAEVANENAESYATFNSFFTRKLKNGARNISAEEKVIICPADGKISQIGKIDKNYLIQAKGKKYTLEELLVRQKLAANFYDGNFITIYLSPKDYHRVHMPLAGKLQKMLYSPGNLFTVNELAVKKISGLFGKNERVITIFETSVGSMALILIGAMIVGSVATSWSGTIMPPNKTAEKIYSKMWRYENQNFVLHRGDEAGYFQLGSTVILLLPPHTINWLNTIKYGDEVKVGQIIGRIIL